MDTTPDAADRAEELQNVRRLRDEDATVDRDPGADAAQVEWEQPDREGVDEPTEDFPTRERQPETQGATPLMAELGPDGDGDVTVDAERPIPSPDEPSVPELEIDQTIPPRPEEEIADVLRAKPDLEDHSEH